MGSLASTTQFCQKILLSSPQILKFSVHKTPTSEIFSSQDPLSEAMIRSQAQHIGNQGRTPLPEKVEIPPGWRPTHTQTHRQKKKPNSGRVKDKEKDINYTHIKRSNRQSTKQSGNAEASTTA